MPRSFAQAFREAMAHAELDTSGLAEKSGVPASTISKWRGMANIPRPDSLQPVLKPLGISIEDLLDQVITPWGMPLCRGDANSNSNHSSSRGHPESERPSVQRRRTGSR